MSIENKEAPIEMPEYSPEELEDFKGQATDVGGKKDKYALSEGEPGHKNRMDESLERTGSATFAGTDGKGLSKPSLENAQLMMDKLIDDIDELAVKIKRNKDESGDDLDTILKRVDILNNVTLKLDSDDAAREKKAKINQMIDRMRNTLTDLIIENNSL